MTATKASVLARIKEYDKVGKTNFLKTHAGSHAAKNYYIVYNGKLYDLKAIYAAACNPPIRPSANNSQFSKKELKKLGFQCITEGGSDQKGMYPNEVEDTKKIVEGAKIKVLVNKYERDKTARIKCIEHYDCKCMVCELDFTEKYGEHGAGFIHVHHLKPLHTIANKYVVDPIADLRPVCPNCHAMIHYRGGLLSIERLRTMLGSAGAKNSN